MLKLIKDSFGTDHITVRRGGNRGVNHAAIATVNHFSNCTEPYQAVPEEEVSKGENIISSHDVYILKDDKKGKMRLKARIFSHVNRDRMKYDVFKDSATAQLDVLRMDLSISTSMEAVLGDFDFKEAQLHTYPIQRTKYVRPLQELGAKQEALRMLTKLPYRITEEGRHWAMVFERWLKSDAGMKQVSKIDQLFLKRLTDRSIIIAHGESYEQPTDSWSSKRFAELCCSASTAFCISKPIIGDRM